MKFQLILLKYQAIKNNYHPWEWACLLGDLQRVTWQSETYSQPLLLLFFKRQTIFSQIWFHVTNSISMMITIAWSIPLIDLMFVSLTLSILSFSELPFLSLFCSDPLIKICWFLFIFHATFLSHHWIEVVTTLDPYYESEFWKKLIINIFVYIVSSVNRWPLYIFLSFQ